MERIVGNTTLDYAAAAAAETFKWRTMNIVTEFLQRQFLIIKELCIDNRILSMQIL